MTSANAFTSESSKLAARFASGGRQCHAFKLTIDTNLRRVTLPRGGWRLFGCATQVYYLQRAASDAVGTPATGVIEPVIGELIASTAGAAAGYAYSTLGDLTAADASGAVRGAIPLPTDTTDYHEIAVADGCFANLYLLSSGSVNAILVGPFE